MQRLLRILICCTYPFLALSVLLLAGMSFGAVFIADFTIENQTDGVIFVTPVGTVGNEGRKYPLPVTMVRFFPLPALQNGAFRLQSREAVTISYDMDDINFSEIVVVDNQARKFQIVTDPNPTTNQYHGPLQQHYVITDLASLDELVPAVGAAADAARKHWSAALRVHSIIFGPWVAYGVLSWILHRYNQRRELTDKVSQVAPQ